MAAVFNLGDEGVGMKMRFHKSRYMGYWHINIVAESRAKQTIEYFFNGTKPMLWGVYDC